MFKQESDGIYIPIDWAGLPKNRNKIPSIHLNSIENGIFEEKKPVKIKPKPTCVNCSAPLHGFKCEYCGTEYEYEKTTQDPYCEPQYETYTDSEGYLHRELLKPYPVPPFLDIGKISASNLCAGFASIKNLECENAHF